MMNFSTLDAEFEDKTINAGWVSNGTIYVCYSYPEELIGGKYKFTAKKTLESYVSMLPGEARKLADAIDIGISDISLETRPDRTMFMSDKDVVTLSAKIEEDRLTLTQKTVTYFRDMPHEKITSVTMYPDTLAKIIESVDAWREARISYYQADRGYCANQAELEDLALSDR